MTLREGAREGLSLQIARQIRASTMTNTSATARVRSTGARAGRARLALSGLSAACGRSGGKRLDMVKAFWLGKQGQTVRQGENKK